MKGTRIEVSPILLQTLNSDNHVLTAFISNIDSELISIETSFRQTFSEGLSRRTDETWKDYFERQEDAARLVMHRVRRGRDLHRRREILSAYQYDIERIVAHANRISSIWDMVDEYPEMAEIADILSMEFNRTVNEIIRPRHREALSQEDGLEDLSGFDFVTLPDETKVSIRGEQAKSILECLLTHDALYNGVTELELISKLWPNVNINESNFKILKSRLYKSMERTKSYLNGANYIIIKSNNKYSLMKTQQFDDVDSIEQEEQKVPA